MRIRSILLENIKCFKSDGALFDFGGLAGIYTVSGENGSGKTAIFKSIQLFQKIFFFDQIDSETEPEYETLYKNIWHDLDSLMSTETSLIDICFTDEDYSFRLELFLKKNHTGWKYNIKPGSEGDSGLLAKYWDIQNPKSIIAFIDAGKSFSEFGVSFDKIALNTKRDKSRVFLLDCIFNPEKTLQSIYKKTVIDHIQYRLDPNRTYPYFKKANAAIKEINPSIEVTNISTTRVDGQVVIVGKTNKETPLFDIKDFSSGERSLYLTLLFLFYVPDVSVLIIDEPENHLHESLLCRFHDFLEKFISSTGTVDIETTKIEQIFLTTHSRALIYKNMYIGQSFAMAGNELSRIESSNIERELRASGISTVYSRTLFVEGTTETSLMADFFDRERIKVIAVNNCKEVISYFEKIASIRKTIHGAAFCFAMDSDNRTEDEIDAIRRIDKEFYDQSFFILDCHEIENLFIDELLIIEVINKIRIGLDMEIINAIHVYKIMEDVAKETKHQSLYKYLASGLKMEIKNKISDPVIDIKKMRPKTSNETTSDLIKKTIADVFSENNKQNIENTVLRLTEKFHGLWDNDWKKYVDGKSYLNKLCTKLSNECNGVNSSRIREMIIKAAKESPEKYKFGIFYSDVRNKFNLQNALQ